MELKRPAISLFAVFAALAILGSADQAHADLFCGQKCKQKKELKRQTKANEDAARRGYALPYPELAQPQTQAQPQSPYDTQRPTYPPTYPAAQPQVQPQDPNADYYQQQQEAARRAAEAQAAYQAQIRAQQQYPQTTPQYPSYSQPPTYTPPQTYQPSYSGYSYSNYDYRSTYVQLTYTDWTQFAAPPYGYVPTPLNGPGYDKTAYPVQVNEPEIQGIIKGAIGQGADAEIGAATVNGALVNKFYSLRGYQPAFVTSQGPNAQAAAARDLFMNKVAAKGLDARDYWSKDMEERFNGSQTAFQKAGLDLLMVQSLIRLAGDLQNGRAEPKNVDSYVMIKKRVFADFQALNNIVRPGVNVASGIEAFEPQHQDYKRLEQALASLNEIKARGGWPKLSGAAILKPGVSSPDVPLLRQRLVEMNILPSYQANGSPVYDASLAEAVKQFQFDNKLKSDGIIGRQGFAVLNTSVDMRIMQVRATLEKWRWLPRSLGNRYIMVNIARQEMQVIENGRIVMSMKSVNGKVLRPTNILVDQIVEVDLNPYWNPPPSLIVADIQRQQRDDIEHMTKERVKIFGDGGVEIDPHTVDWKKYITRPAPYQFREEPGITNSLGVVKFQTTNSSAIYLHDTNHREFFDDFDERLLSSGCIRLQKPLDLLQYLLRNNPSYGQAQLDQILSHPESYPHNVVKLGRDAIPFYVFYGTASFDENGKLRFARDAYSLDERIIRAITPIDDEI